MSHSVTVTRTTTTTTTSAILLNTGYFKTYPGLLKLFELLIGAAIVGITAHYGSNYYHNYVTQSPEIFLCIVATTFMVGTACLLLSCILSISTASILPKTLFEVIFHSVATILYLAASINFLVEVNQMKKKLRLQIRTLPCSCHSWTHQHSALPAKHLPCLPQLQREVGCLRGGG